MLHYWDTSDNWVALQFVVALYTVTATQIDIIPLLVHYVIFLIGKWIQISNEDFWVAEEPTHFPSAVFSDFKSVNIL